MDSKKAKEVLDKIVGQVFGFQNPLSLEEALQKFAFDVKLPQQVFDLSGKPTWAQSTNPTKFITFLDALNMPEGHYTRPARQLNDIEDILSAWAEINEMATERVLESLNVAESDCVYNSEDVYRSQTVNRAKNVLFSDTISDAEFILASQRSEASTFCIRLEDSAKCSNSFNVQWCNSIINCFFISDANTLQDCMFTSHMNNKRFMVANMQYDEAEYMRLRDIVARWILTG
ncbi:hypothetical protein EKI60_05265 [Candidatus Saccharibacteria bacterium]|nr:MAG: hypothetical protein EKI60_05265 [Candidatus Saccharibacteria bacterium]